MVDDDDVKSHFLDGGVDAVYALAHQVTMVLGRNDDGYAQAGLQWVAGGKEVESCPRDDGAVRVAAVVVAL